MASAVLAERRDCGAGLLFVTIDVDAGVATKYVAPGQYVRVTPEKGDPGYFVLASNPGDRGFELLVRNAGDAADVLATLPLGSHVDVSEPMGDGFPMNVARGRPLAVAVAGTALAVARPILRERIAESDARTSCVFLGVRAASDVPLASEVEGWIEEGVRVVLCLSRDEAAADRSVLADAARFPGYVQDAIARARTEGTLEPNALVFAAGPVAMLTALRAMSPDIDVVTNA